MKESLATMLIISALVTMPLFAPNLILRIDSPMSSFPEKVREQRAIEKFEVGEDSGIVVHWSVENDRRNG